MPTAPQPFEIRCPACHWHSLWKARSDVLMPAELPPEQCPACGHHPLEARPQSSNALWAALTQVFARFR